MIRAYGDWAQHVHAQAFLAATSVTQLGTGLPGPVPAPEPARDIDPAHLSPPTGPASHVGAELPGAVGLLSYRPDFYSRINRTHRPRVSAPIPTVGLGREAPLSTWLRGHKVLDFPTIHK